MHKKLIKFSVLVTAIASLAGTQLLAQLAIKSVGSIQKKDGPLQVTVVFTEPVDPATAGDPSKYNLGAGVTINAASVLTGLPAMNEAGNGNDPPSGRVVDNQCVVLDVTGLGAASTTLTVNGVQSANGSQTLTGATRAFTPSGYKWVDVAQLYSTPAPGRKAGHVIAVSDQGFDIFNNGRTAYANEDEYTFAYKEITGDFDYVARVEFQDYSSRWSRAGIMVRERLDDGAPPGQMGRYVTAHTDPPTSWSDTGAGVIAGNNAFESNYRPIDFSGDPSHADVANAGTDTRGDSGGTPNYPNGWVRLTRAANVITAYYSNDGQNWSGSWVRSFDPPLPATLYLGPACAVEWGNINTANGNAARARYYLAQIRFGEVTTPYVRSLTGTPVGFIAEIQDALSKFDKSSLLLWLNGTPVTASSVTGPDANGVSTVTYAGTTPLGSGSANTVRMQFKDNATPAPNTITKELSFTVSYLEIPADYATASFSGTKGTMTASAHKMPAGVVRAPGDENSIANAETELQDGFIDPSTGGPVLSEVATDPFQIEMVNHTQNPLEAGYFNATNTPDYPDSDMSFLAGLYGDEYAVQFIAYVELKKGAYRMFVNSDDGFKLSVGPNGPDVVGMILGSYDGGRGMTLNADAPGLNGAPAGFDFVAPADGVYPFRLSFWNGTGDASVEWYSQDYATGQRYLINASVGGTPVAKAIKTYPEGRGRAYIKQFLPYPGKITDPQPSFKITVVDDLTSVVAGSMKLILDGAEITGATINNAGGIHTLTWTPPGPYPLESKHSGQFIYAESGGKSRTNDFNFSVQGISVADLPANTFWIEVEDFDFGKGQSLDIASQMPYIDRAYGTLLDEGHPGAAHDIDYHRTGPGPTSDTALGGYMYRVDIPGWVDEANLITDYFVPMYTDTGGIAGTRPGDPVVTVSINYRTGWSGGGNWYNYTRTLPAGIYAAYLAAGHWNNTDPATPGQIDCDLAKIVGGVGTSNQTLQTIGTFYGPGAGYNAGDLLTTLKGPDGTTAIFKANGKTTFRLTDRAGDIDWIALAPQTGVPPKVVSASPANGSIAGRSAPISVKIEDFSSAAVLSTVKLLLDGSDVTTQANPTKTADITTLLYTPSPIWEPNSTHTYIVNYSDNSTPAKKFSVTNAFRVNVLGAPGQFVIESEDFNYDGGQTKAVASTMPYTGSAYANLGAVFDVDYHNDDDPSWESVYRNVSADTVNLQDVAISVNPFADQNTRGTWDVSPNYKIGWTGGADWQNYTRTFPSGTYNVYAALSFGDANTPPAPNQLRGAFDLVTSGATTTAQTLVRLGTFDAPGTGNWGANALVPMVDANGALASVVLGGAQTVRYYDTSGDSDYFVFVPGAAAIPASIVTPPASQPANVGGSVTFTVVATGTGPITYQWMFNGSDLPGQTGASLTLPSVACANAGNYSVKVTGATGAPVVSPAASLTVNDCEDLKFTSIKVNADGTITIIWTGGGTLQAAPTVMGPWSAVTGASSPFTFAPTEKMLFGRILK